MKRDLCPVRRIIAMVFALLLCPLVLAEELIPRPRPTMQVFNASEQVIDLFWLKSDDEKISNGTVKPGEDYLFTTSLGNRFRAVGRDDGKVMEFRCEVLIQAVRFDPTARDGIPAFYTQRVYAQGFPIVCSAKVNPYALKEGEFLVNQMLAHRPEVRAAMIRSGARMCIMAHNEYTTDLPEHKRLENVPTEESAGKTPKDYWDSRARGLGGSEQDPVCSAAEENILSFEGDPYATECIFIHEFAHNIHLRGMNNVDPTFDMRLRAAYDAAMKAGLWKGKYASVNHHEYFAEGAQSWFDDNRVHDAAHNHVHLREQLIEYDPALAALCREVFGDAAFRYSKPTKRLKDHLKGYDPKKSPRFEWPERLRR